MGLDMYITKAPKIVGLSYKEMYAIDAKADLDSSEDRGKYSLEEWCGIKESELPCKELCDKALSYRHKSYPCWDTKKAYPRVSIFETVGYWRKANQVHKWFEDHITEGWPLDNCSPYYVPKLLIEELRDDCAKVLNKVVMMAGKVKNGSTLTALGFKPNYESGYYVCNPEVCREIMPTTDGFFFGSTDYDQYYVDDLRHTYELCCKLLNETNFGQYELYYEASW